MGLKILIGLALLIALYIGARFFAVCGAYVFRVIARALSEPSEDEDLTEEEKYKLYIEKKNRELLKEQAVAKELSDDATRGNVKYNDEVRIIGFIEPIGKWTRLVMSEKRQRLAGLKPNQLQNGFWQMLVSMKGLYQGKHRGRSR